LTLKERSVVASANSGGTSSTPGSTVSFVRQAAGFTSFTL